MTAKLYAKGLFIADLPEHIARLRGDDLALGIRLAYPEITGDRQEWSVVKTSPQRGGYITSDRKYLLASPDEVRAYDEGQRQACASDPFIQSINHSMHRYLNGDRFDAPPWFACGTHHFRPHEHQRIHLLGDAS